MKSKEQAGRKRLQKGTRKFFWLMVIFIILTVSYMCVCVCVYMCVYIYIYLTDIYVCISKNITIHTESKSISHSVMSSSL